MIKTTRDVRALIERRLEDWEKSKFKILLQEAKRCSQKLPRKPMKKKHILRRAHRSGFCTNDDGRESSVCHALADKLIWRRFAPSK